MLHEDGTKKINRQGIQEGSKGKNICEWDFASKCHLYIVAWALPTNKTSFFRMFFF